MANNNTQVMTIIKNADGSFSIMRNNIAESDSTRFLGEAYKAEAKKDREALEKYKAAWCGTTSSKSYENATWE